MNSKNSRLRVFSFSFIGRIAVIISVTVSPRLTNCAETVEIQHVIEVLKATEGQIITSRWKAKSTVAELANPKDVSSIVKTEPVYTDCDVVSDPVQQRFRINWEHVSTWVDGTAPFVSGRQCISYDGTYRSWERTKPGSTVPAKDEGRVFGEIRKDINSPSRSMVWLSGMAYMPPLFYDFVQDPKPLSEFIRQASSEGVPVSVKADSDGLWTITVIDRQKYSDRMIIRLDPSKGCSLQGVEWSGPNRVWKRLNVKMRQLSNSFWVPEKLELVYLLDNPSQLVTLDYSDVEINPSLPDDVFRCTFTEGTQIDDFVEHKSYIVGSSPTNEQAAIQSFIVRQGLKRSDQSVTGKSGAKIALIVINIIIILLILLFIILKRKTKGVGVGLLILAYLSPTSAFSATPESTTDGWLVSHSKGEQIRVTQCGFHVAVYALEQLGCKYNVDKVAKALQPNQQGVVLQDLRDILVAHGLKVDARKGVAPSELARALTANNLAIFPVRLADGRNHYLVAELDSTGNARIVDVLREAMPLAGNLGDGDLKATDGVVLFITRPTSTAKPMSEQIQFTPSKLDAGAFAVVGENAAPSQTLRFDLENTASEPIFVNEIRRSCSCAEPSWAGGLLQGHEKKSVEIKLDTRMWGIGPQERRFDFFFPDGSSKRILLTGIGLQPNQSKGLEFSSETVHFDLTGSFDGGEVAPSAEIIVRRIDGSPVGSLLTDTTSPWIIVKSLTRSESEASIGISLALSKKLWKDLAVAGSSGISGAVQVKSQADDADTYLIKVVASRHPFYEISPPTISLKERSRVSESVSIVPIKGRTERITLIKAWSDPSGLTLENKQSNDGKSIICSIRANSQSTKVQYYVVHYEIESAQGEPGIASVLVSSTK